MSELMAEPPSDEALNLTAGSKRPPREAEAEVPLKKRKKVNFNLTLNLTEVSTRREPSASPELLQRVPSEASAGSTAAPGSDLDEQIPTTPGGRLQVDWWAKMLTTCRSCLSYARGCLCKWDV